MSDVSEALAGLSHVISTVCKQSELLHDLKTSHVISIVSKQSELIHDLKTSVPVNLYVIKCQQKVRGGA